ncbi:MAG: deoxyribodipyrimidine photo-lyase [Phycisphaerales bacterium]|nr:deoxyribodipyrimidine photo-lyase [Phycisphaerales bacterium]
MAVAIVWFRSDLRLHDNPALSDAIKTGAPIIPMFIHSPDEEAEAAPGAASRWWLANSLRALDVALRKLGGGLVIRRGRAADAIAALIRETGATAVYWNRRYEPAIIARDGRIKAQLQQRGISAESHNGSLLFEPWEISTQDGRPYRVYTPFSKACFAREPHLRPLLPAPKKIPWPAAWPKSLEIDDLQLEPRIDWAAGFRDTWSPGEAGAAATLRRFESAVVADYSTSRDIPGVVGTSRLSPHLHFGEISPLMVWREVSTCAPKDSTRIAHSDGGSTFRNELLWREFAHHLLYHFPRTVAEPLDARFATFPRKHDARGLKAWQSGQTGFPIVDAGMRELWHTGWMHNRVRMVAASLLVKHLLIPWQAGAAWFWDTLVDADLANNTLGWQWIAGCGADAAPFFRIFNPTLQGEKFDPDGLYVRRWVPELAELPVRYIHNPSSAPEDVVRSAGVLLGKTYPAPIVDHAAARSAALAAYEHVKRAAP